MVLLDPVDATVFERATIMPALRKLSVPTAICGSAVGGECAPTGSNYAEYFRALGGDAEPALAPPRLLAQLRRAGHSQYVDRRDQLLDVPQATDTTVEHTRAALVELLANRGAATITMRTPRPKVAVELRLPSAAG